MENKKRCSNFSRSEEQRLLDLVHKFRHKVENKKTDTDANRLKKEAWISIEKEFNIYGFETYRNASILKRKYENIKKRTKAKFADEKKYVLGTGGGPAKSVNVTTADEIIKEIIGDQLTGRTSQYDNDAIIEERETESPVINLSAEMEATQSLLEEEVTTYQSNCTEFIKPSGTQPSSSIQNKSATHFDDIAELAKKGGENIEVADWSSYSADKLRTPNSVPLKRKATVHGSLSKKLCNWAENKSEMEDVRKKLINEEHKIRLKQIQEIHELTVAQMKEKHQLYVKECRLKMQILKEEHLNRMKTYSNNTNC